MYRVIAGYVAKLPGAVKEGSRLYSTHSLRATTATLLLDAGVRERLLSGSASISNNSWLKVFVQEDPSLMIGSMSTFPSGRPDSVSV